MYARRGESWTAWAAAAGAWKRALPLLSFVFLLLALHPSLVRAASALAAAVGPPGASPQELAARLGRMAGVDGVTLRVVDAGDTFSRVYPGRREIVMSRRFLETLRARAGAKGLTFVLAHEVAHLDPGLRGLKGPALELAVDEKALSLARRIHPDLRAGDVERALVAFDAKGGRWKTFLQRIRTALDRGHPTDTVRMNNLARAADYDAARGWDTASDGGYVNRVGRGPGRGALRGFLLSGVLTDVAVAAGVGLACGLHDGRPLGESLAGAVRTVLSPVFLLGNVGGGLLGAALGAMVPIPLGMAAMGLLGNIAAAFPVMAGAMLGSSLGVALLSRLGGDGFSWGAVWKDARIGQTLASAMGATVGMTVGALFPGFQYVGALVGGWLGGLLAARLHRILFGGGAGAAERPQCPADAGGAAAPYCGSTEVKDVVPRPASPAAGMPADDPARLESMKAEAYRGYVKCVRRADRTGAARWLDSYMRLDAALRRIRRSGAGGRSDGTGAFLESR